MTQAPADIIVADPPWRFASNSQTRPGRNAMRHYPCMPLDEICAVPVAEWAARPALLFLWATSPMLPQALGVVAAWGFRFKSSLVWVKKRPGTGFWVRNRHELVLLAGRGRFACPTPAPFPDSVITSPARRHSEKPEDLQDRIDLIWPEARKLELFARRPRDGWEVWGNDVGLGPRPLEADQTGGEDCNAV